MAITKNAKKAIRSAERKRVVNVRRKRTMHDVLGEVKKLVAAKKSAEASALLAKAYQAIDKAAKRGVIKKNAANRKKSRLAAAIKKAKEIK